MTRLPIPSFVLLAGLIAALGALVALPAAAAELQPDMWKSLEIGEVVTVNGYELSVAETADRFVQLLRVTRNGQELIAIRDQGFSVHQPSLGSDITASGSPHVAIRGWGADGGYGVLHDELHVLRLGESFHAVPKVQFDWADVNLIDLDRRPGLEVETADLWFTYETNTTYRSPVGRVALRFDGSRYVVAADLLRHAGPSDHEIEIRVEQAKAVLSEDASLGEVFWGTMVAWIYQGNLAAACQFYERTWRETYARADNVRWTYRKRFALDNFLQDVRRRGDNEGMPGLWAAIAELNNVPVDGELSCPSVSR